MHRILYLGPVPPEFGGQSVGGIATHAWALARYVANNSECFHVVMYHGSRGGARHCDGVLLCGKRTGAVRVVWGRIKQLIAMRRLNRNDAIKVRIRYLVETYNPQIIHVHSLHNPFTEIIKDKYPHLPVVVTDHGFWSRVIFEHIDADRCDILQNVEANYSKADAVIAVSEYCQFMEDKSFGMRENRLIIPNPINSTLFHYKDQAIARSFLGWKQTRKILLFVSNEKSLKQKGLSQVLEAASILRDKYDICVAIVGTDSMPDIALSVPKPPVIVLGKRKQSEMPIVFSASDLLVLPSASESYGLVYAEALMSGVCCVGFEFVIEEFGKRLNCYVGEPIPFSKREDPRHLAVTIQRALDQSQHVNPKTLSEAAKRELSWEVSGKSYISLYEELLKQTTGFD